MLYEQGLLIPCFPAQNTRIINVFPVEEFLMQEDVCSFGEPLWCVWDHTVGATKPAWSH